MIRTWNSENATLIVSWMDSVIGKQKSAEVKNWDEITFNYNEDRYEFSTSTTGQITRSKIQNKLGAATVVCMSGSDCNAVLGDLINSSAKITVSLVERMPNTLGVSTSNAAEWLLSDGSISSAGDASRGRVAGQRTWVITGEISKITDGEYSD